MFKLTLASAMIASAFAVKIQNKQEDASVDLKSAENFIKEFGFDVKQGVSGEEAERAASMAMDLMDADKDGVVKMEEAPQELKPFVTMHDKDGNGGINKEEMKNIAHEYGIHISPEKFLENEGFTVGDDTAEESEFVNAAEKGFSMMDHDKDGKLTAEEIPDELEADGFKFDDDKNGVVTYDELLNLAKTYHITIGKEAFLADYAFDTGAEKISGQDAKLAAERAFCLMNADGDKFISIEDEVPAELKEFALAGDKDGNGKISKKEMKKIAKAHGITVNEDKAVENAEKLVKDLGFEFSEEEISDADAEAAAKKAIELFDWSKDGDVTKTELPCDLRQFYDQADANKDGVADQDELTALYKSFGITIA